MNYGPLHIAYGRVDEHDVTDFDCTDSVELPRRDGTHDLFTIELPGGTQARVVVIIGPPEPAPTKET